MTKANGLGTSTKGSVALSSFGERICDARFYFIFDLKQVVTGMQV